MFQQAPNPGPPAGNEYHTVGYELFEPFKLQQEQQGQPVGLGATNIGD
jgi:hypothetical protein